MKAKISKLIIFMILLFLVIPSVNIVKADNHRYFEDDYSHKADDDWDDEEDDEEDDDNDKWKKEHFQESTVQPSYWNIWTRDINVIVSKNLPIQEAKLYPFELNGKTANFLVLPYNGQLFVSGEKMADFLGIKNKFYSQSRILELSKDETELIVRAGSNAAYENMLKMPMPATAMYYENTVYLPVSVIANAFGYRVNWDENKQMFILELFKERGEQK